MRVLLLGGTGEARELAARVNVVTSLAGRVSDPRLPVGEVRIGGFGGPDGLAAWLRAERIDAIVDATHPFAERITANAVEAARECEVPLLVVRRPAWAPRPGDDWRPVPSLNAAAELLKRQRVFLTIGRQGLAAFSGIDSCWFLIRCVDPPSQPLPRYADVVLSRGPFTVSGESDLLRRHRIDVLVTKNSGGRAAAAKLAAARELGVPVVIVDRPALPGGVPVVSTVDEAVAWLNTPKGNRLPTHR